LHEGGSSIQSAVGEDGRSLTLKESEMENHGKGTGKKEEERAIKTSKAKPPTWESARLGKDGRSDCLRKLGCFTLDMEGGGGGKKWVGRGSP